MAKVNKDIGIKGERRLFFLLKLAIVGLVIVIISILAGMFMKQADYKNYYFAVGSNLGDTNYGIDGEFKDKNEPIRPVDVMKINYEENKDSIKVNYLTSSTFSQFSFCEIVNEKREKYESSYCNLPLLTADGNFGFYTNKVNLSDVYIEVYENDLQHRMLQINIDSLGQDKKVEISKNNIAELIKDNTKNELNYIKESLQKNPLDTLAFAIDNNNRQIANLNYQLKEDIDADTDVLLNKIQELKDENSRLSKQDKIYKKNAQIKDETSLAKFKKELREKYNEN